MELTTKYKISYSLLLLSLSAIIYVRLNLDAHKPTMAKLLKLKAYPISNDPKKLSSTFLSKDFNNVNSIPGTTGPGIPNIIRSTLSTKYGPVDESATSFYGAGSGIYILLKKVYCSFLNQKLFSFSTRLSIVYSMYLFITKNNIISYSLSARMASFVFL